MLKSKNFLKLKNYCTDFSSHCVILIKNLTESNILSILPKGKFSLLSWFINATTLGFLLIFFYKKGLILKKIKSLNLSTIQIYKTQNWRCLYLRRNYVKWKPTLVTISMVLVTIFSLVVFSVCRLHHYHHHSNKNLKCIVFRAQKKFLPAGNWEVNSH